MTKVNKAVIKMIKEEVNERDSRKGFIGNRDSLKKLKRITEAFPQLKVAAFMAAVDLYI